jgi:3-hydroxyacyl-CoA dehydrogenase/enoyl-CoA hydratase/3-hydroxybutyryl-CoA epimerase
MMQYKNWRTEVDSQNIFWLYFDKANESVNSFNQAVLDELNQIVDDIANRKNLIGVIFCSGKKKGFIAGADIKELSAFTNADDAVAFIRFGQRVFDKIENLKIPTVALISGFCMGGGTELALACRYRIAADTDDTLIGLPEVKLGIHPGWGGTVRLPLLIGAPKAMDIILSGRSLSARAAKKMGLVDTVLSPKYLLTAARDYINRKPGRHQASTLEKLTNLFIARPILAKILRKKVIAKANPVHYPSPLAVIDNWARHGVGNHNEAMITEANSIGELLLASTPKNLIRVFNLSEKMKALAKGVEFSPKHIHVIGAGVMGGDIAAWCALRGMKVTLEDREPKYLSAAMGRAAKLFNKKLKQVNKITAALDRLIPDVTGMGAKTADVIIEAIFENLEAKQALFKRLETEARPDAILASNTSSIPLEEISVTMSKPSRLIGIHFFNPVDKMPLVEVVKGVQSDASEVKKALAFVVKIGRQPIEVKSSPGFLVNRVLMPYMMEAMYLLQEGVPAPAIDKATVAFGMPMGPIELADTVGLDICLSVAKNLSKHYGGTVPEQLEKMVAAKTLGRKTGKGFYVYKNGKPIKLSGGSSPLNQQLIQQRLIDRMLNEAVACYREGVITDLELLDGGMIFGTGFAPYTGGPINYAQAVGVANIKTQLTKFAEQYGERFKPDAGWDTL